jgi:transcriptional regulator with XRE-family HTH domain
MARRSIGHYNTLDKHAENRTVGEKAIYAEFGRRLQARMINLGWNQSELSRRATAYLPKPAKGQVQGHTLGRDRISCYIRGLYLPRPDALQALSKALRCEASDLLPPEGVPSVIESPAMEMKSMEGNRVAIRLNRVVSSKTATDIMNLLAKEDKL